LKKQILKKWLGSRGALVPSYIRQCLQQQSTISFVFLYNFE